MSNKFKVQFKNTNPTTWVDKLNPFIPDLNQPFTNELREWIKENLINPMFTPDDPALNVALMDVSSSKATPITKDDLVDGVVEDNFNINQDNDDQKQLSTVFQQAATYVDPNQYYTYQQQFMTDLIKASGNKLPDANIRYTFNIDILPSTRELLTDFTNQQKRDNFNMGWAGYFYNNPLQRQLNITAFPNYKAQEDFQLYLNQYIMNNPTGNPLIDNKIQQASQSKASSDFNTTWLLGDGKYDTDELSVNKIILHVLNQYLADPANADKAFMVPTSIKQTMVPTSFCLINLANLSQMDTRDFRHELNVLANGVNYLNKFDFASMKSLATADSVDKSLTKQHTPKHKNNHTGDQHLASNRRSFSKKNLSIKQQIKMVKKLLTHCVSTMPSSNTFKTKHPTFMRGNRRHPDDINLPGQVTKTAYRPDIAIYLDTSGSISEDEYKNAVTLLIKLTQALDTNLYFTSFSHYVSQPVKLNTKHHSAKSIYKQIQSIPKVGGGTEYENVWKLINYMNTYTKQNHQADQLNFIITDFEYDLSSSCVLKPKSASMQNTYYLPMRENGSSDQDYLIRSATNFAEEMLHSGFPGIYRHMIL